MGGTFKERSTRLSRNKRNEKSEFFVIVNVTRPHHRTGSLRQLVRTHILKIEKSEIKMVVPVILNLSISLIGFQCSY